MSAVGLICGIALIILFGVIMVRNLIGIIKTVKERKKNKTMQVDIGTIIDDRDRKED